MAEEEPIELGQFGFGIKVLRKPDGEIIYTTRAINKKIPIEVIMAQMKAFLNKMEKEYFDKFDKDFSSVEFKF